MKRSYKNSKSSSKKTYETTSNSSPPLSNHTLILMKDPSGNASSNMHAASSSGQMTIGSGVDLDPDPDPDPYRLLSSSSSTSSSDLSVIIDTKKFFVKEPKKLANNASNLANEDGETNGDGSLEPLTSFFEKLNQDEDESTEGVDDDGNREILLSDSILKINSNNDNDNNNSSKSSISDKNINLNNFGIFSFFLEEYHEKNS
jgi:hypothetical protein